MLIVAINPLLQMLFCINLICPFMLLIHLEACDKKVLECKFVVELNDKQPIGDFHLSIKDLAWALQNYYPFIRIPLFGAMLIVAINPVLQMPFCINLICPFM